MKPRTCFVAVYVALGFAATLHAQAECADWNTGAFFEVTEVSDVTRCLQSGLDPQARGEAGHTPRCIGRRTASVNEALEPSNHELAFGLFQICTLSFAYSASIQRKQRKFMGIRKGIFG